MSELEELLEERKALDAKIRALRSQRIECGRVRYLTTDYAYGQAHEIRIAIDDPRQRNPRFYTMIRSLYKPDVIASLECLRSDIDRMIEALEFLSL